MAVSGYQVDAAHSREWQLWVDPGRHLAHGPMAAIAPTRPATAAPPFGWTGLPSPRLSAGSRFDQRAFAASAKQG